MPPGVVVLRIPEVIAKMEDLLLRAASFFDAGQDDELVIGRPQMTLGISALLKKSKLEGRLREARAPALRPAVLGFSRRGTPTAG